jgi:hypothetical protein
MLRVKIFKFKLQLKIHFDGPEGNRLIRRCRHRLEDNIRMDIKGGK